MFNERDVQALFDALDAMRECLDDMADETRVISNRVETLCLIATELAATTSKGKPAPP